jgi:hypothetical protein
MRHLWLVGIVFGAFVLPTLPQTAGKVTRLVEPASIERGTKSINAAAQLLCNLAIPNGLADPRHESLHEGDAPPAMKSTGIGAIIGQMTGIKKAQSVTLIRIAATRKPLRWP